MGLNVALRVDASLTMGTGHVYRCLTLASQLRQHGHRVVFICRQLPGNLIDLITAHDFRVLRLSQGAMTTTTANDHCQHGDWLGVDYQQEIAQAAQVVDHYLGEIGCTQLDWLIIDHYGIEHRWHTAMRSRCRQVLQIDDLADRDFDCDILLDQNFYLNMDSRYDARCAAATTKLIGPKFALLNEMFGQLQSQLAPYPQRLTQGQVLFFFGGIDKDNETLKALKGVAPLLRQYQLTGQVILGKHNPHQADVAAFCRDFGQLSLAVQVDDMARRMAHAFLYIGAVGATVWERCSLALPAITSTVALNQQALAESLSQIDAHLCLGPQQQTRSADYARAFITLMNSPERLQAQSSTVAQMVDALGCSRVVDVMESMNDH